MKIEKIIFLDFDGAVVTQKTNYRKLDPIAIEHLKHIIDKTNAFIVVSSVWRKFKTLGQLKDMFQEFGLFSRLIDVTDVLPGSMVRGQEIHKWLTDPHPMSFDIKSFVIIDDDSDMDPHMDRLVQTDTQVGLTEEDAKKCIEMLNNT